MAQGHCLENNFYNFIVKIILLGTLDKSYEKKIGVLKSKDDSKMALCVNLGALTSLIYRTRTR